MTIELLDPNDTGDIPRIDDLGDEPTRNLRAERDKIRRSLGHLRDVTDELPVIDRMPKTIGVVEPFALGEWDNPVDTARLSILGSLGAPGGLSTPPTSPPPLPKPPRPAAPKTFRDRLKYKGEHRAVREEHPFRGLVWFVAVAALAVAGLWQVL